MEVISLVIFGILIVLSPGSDFVLVFKNSSMFGRKAGVVTALGIGLGVCVHISYSVIGISHFISHNPSLFNFVKYAGAGYLIYLGISGLRSTKFRLKAQDSSPKTQQRTFLIQGFLCNLLNPKTMLFFISIFSQLIESDNNTFSIGYGVYIAALHCLWFTLLSYLLTSTKARHFLERFGQRINQLCGVGLVGFGASLLTA